MDRVTRDPPFDMDVIIELRPPSKTVLREPWTVVPYVGW
jgi:hypothetical protein